MSESIRYEIGENLARITLNRPDKLNAFTGEMHQNLQHALDQAEKDGARAILITGAGRGFCAGQDLSERKRAPGDAPPDLSESIARWYNPLIKRLKAIPVPIVCAVNGVAAGAGANIALACDIVIAAASARFIQSFAKIGLVPDSGGTWTLPQLLGPARAKGLAMLGTPVSAEQAKDWGMIWDIAEDDELSKKATEIGIKLANGPTLGLSLTKQAIDQALLNSLDAQLDLEADLQKQAGQSEDYREGVQAFLEKRQPDYTGK